MTSEAFNAPWKVFNRFRCWISHPPVRLLFALNGIPWGRGWRFYGLPVIQKHRRSRMRFGGHLQLRSTLRSNPLGPYHPVILCTWQPGAVLEVGDRFGMTGGTICAAERVTIGNNVIMGANSTIIDTDFHLLYSQGRRLRVRDVGTAPVMIEDDVFIGMNCIILKGVRIGCGSIVGAGSVITRDVPPVTLVAGNPARVIRKIAG